MEGRDSIINLLCYVHSMNLVSNRITLGSLLASSTMIATVIVIIISNISIILISYPVRNSNIVICMFHFIYNYFVFIMFMKNTLLVL